MIVIKHPHGRMRIHPDVLIRNMSQESYKSWVRFFARYGDDEDITLFKEKLEAAKRDEEFLGTHPRKIRRYQNMLDMFQTALKKEMRA